MNITCEFCGDIFTAYDNRRRKYCPKCGYSIELVTSLFKKKRAENPVTDIYTKHYGKRLASCKRGKISKAVLEDWRLKAKKKRYNVSAGKISIEDFTEWCEQTYECLFYKEIGCTLMESLELNSFAGEAGANDASYLTLIQVCEFCGEDYAVHDARKRKYCPKCQNSSERYSQQFREKCEKNPIMHIYSKHYKKRAEMCRKRKITRDTLEDWKMQAKIKQHQVSIGEITFEDFKNWCEQTYKSLRRK